MYLFCEQLFSNNSFYISEEEYLIPDRCMYFIMIENVGNMVNHKLFEFKKVKKAEIEMYDYRVFEENIKIAFINSEYISKYAQFGKKYYLKSYYDLLNHSGNKPEKKMIKECKSIQASIDYDLMMKFFIKKQLSYEELLRLSNPFEKKKTIDRDNLEEEEIYNYYSLLTRKLLENINIEIAFNNIVNELKVNNIETDIITFIEKKLYNLLDKRYRKIYSSLHGNKRSILTANGNGSLLTIAHLTPFEFDIKFSTIWTIIKSALTVVFVPIIILLAQDNVSNKITSYIIVGIIYLISLILSEEKLADDLLIQIQQISGITKLDYADLFIYGILPIIYLLIMLIQINFSFIDTSLLLFSVINIGFTCLIFVILFMIEHMFVSVSLFFYTNIRLKSFIGFIKKHISSVINLILIFVGFASYYVFCENLKQENALMDSLLISNIGICSLLILSRILAKNKTK